MSGCVDLVDDKLDHMLWKASGTSGMGMRQNLDCYDWGNKIESTIINIHSPASLGYHPGPRVLTYTLFFDKMIYNVYTVYTLW